MSAFSGLLYVTVNTMALKRHMQEIQQEHWIGSIFSTHALAGASSTRYSKSWGDSSFLVLIFIYQLCIMCRVFEQFFCTGLVVILPTFCPQAMFLYVGIWQPITVQHKTADYMLEFVLGNQRRWVRLRFDRRMTVISWKWTNVLWKHFWPLVVLWSNNLWADPSIVCMFVWHQGAHPHCKLGGVGGGGGG